MRGKMFPPCKQNGSEEVSHLYFLAIKMQRMPKSRAVPMATTLGMMM